MATKPTPPSKPMTKSRRVAAKQRVIDAADAPLTDKASVSAAADVTGTQVARSGAGDQEQLVSRSSRIHTLEQLLAYAEVDRERWDVEKFVVNKWEMGAKHPETGEILTEPLFQVKAWLKRRAGVEVATRAAVAEMLEDMRRHAPKHARVMYPKADKAERHSLVLSVPDLHLGKLAWGKETGADYDLKITKELFRTAVRTLVTRTRGFQFEEIVLPCGNDLFQSDNYKNMTTAGTPVDSDGRWQQVITEGRRMLVEAIDYLAGIAPVRVVMVPGNHDMERVFSTGEILSAWYRNDANVTVDNTPRSRKYWEYGQCLVMWTHGDKEKRDNLPLIAATENAAGWGRTKFREVHTGHLHCLRSTKFKDVEEFSGVRVRILPSLSAPDQWHDSKGFFNIRSAEALVYHRENGCVATMSYNLPAK